MTRFYLFLSKFLNAIRLTDSCELIPLHVHAFTATSDEGLNTNMLCSTCSQVLQIDLSGNLDDEGNLIRVPRSSFDWNTRILRLSDYQKRDGLESPWFRLTGTVQELLSGVSQSCHICSERWSSLSSTEQSNFRSMDRDATLTLYLVSFEISDDDSEPYLFLELRFIIRNDGDGMKFLNRGHHFDLHIDSSR